MQLTGSKKILFICDRIPPEHSATGKIAFYLSKELAKTNDVFLVCLSSGGVPAASDVSINAVSDRYGKYKRYLKSALGKRGILNPAGRLWAKIYYKFAEKRGLCEVCDHEKIILKKCLRIINENSIDTVISVSNPFSCQRIAQKVKSRYGNVSWFAYMMDSNRNNAVNAGSAVKEKQILERAKKIFIMPALLNDADFCKDFADKTVVVPLPIIPVCLPESERTDTEKTVFTYAGLFYKNIRSPKNLLDMFSRFPEDCILRLYSRGCAEIIESYKEVLGDRLEVNGFLPPEELLHKIADSDVLVNIGNTVSNQIPSKVYESISYGKPLLNFFQSDRDMSLQDLSKYPLCKSVNYNAVDQKTAAQIADWVKAHKNDALSYEEATEKLTHLRLSEIAKTVISEIQ